MLQGMYDNLENSTAIFARYLRITFSVYSGRHLKMTIEKFNFLIRGDRQYRVKWKDRRASREEFTVALRVQKKKSGRW